VPTGTPLLPLTFTCLHRCCFAYTPTKSLAMSTAAGMPARGMVATRRMTAATVAVISAAVAAGGPRLRDRLMHIQLRPRISAAAVAAGRAA
jgi:hypothetical protein